MPPDDEEMMQGPAAMLLAMEDAEAAKAPTAEKKPADSGFEGASNRMFQALGGDGDPAAFRSAFRAAFKVLLSESEPD